MMTTVKQIDISEAYNDLSWATGRVAVFGDWALRVAAAAAEPHRWALFAGRIET